MLTKDLAIVEFRNSERHPDRLTTRTHADYQDRAARMVEIYRDGIGKRRRELHQAVEAIFDDDENYAPKRVLAFCRLLDQKSKFNEDKHGVSLKLRTKVFGLSAPGYPLVTQPSGLFGSARSEATAAIAKEIGQPWDEIEESLFDDVKEFQRLIRFAGFEAPSDLLARYNVAQFQAALYDAVSMTITAGENLKEILRYAKLARLMHTITKLPNGRYQFFFDGPASLMSESQKYGHRMAQMIPGLLSCSDWKLHATFNAKGWRSFLQLDHKCGLRSPVVSPDEFDSDLEADFSEKWGAKVREGWSLTRESEVLSSGQKVFVPDFRLEHTDGRCVLLEIVGYWRRKYLEAKRETLAAFSDRPVLVAVADSKVDQFSGLGYSTVDFGRHAAADWPYRSRQSPMALLAKEPKGEGDLSWSPLVYLSTILCFGVQCPDMELFRRIHRRTNPDHR